MSKELDWGEHTLPAGHAFTDDDGRERTCDGETQCDACNAEDSAYWASYFGISKSQTPEERARKLEQFRPVTDEDHLKAWEFKRYGKEPDNE